MPPNAATVLLRSLRQIKPVSLLPIPRGSRCYSRLKETKAPPRQFSASRTPQLENSFATAETSAAGARLREEKKKVGLRDRNPLELPNEFLVVNISIDDEDAFRHYLTETCALGSEATEKIRIQFQYEDGVFDHSAVLKLPTMDMRDYFCRHLKWKIRTTKLDGTYLRCRPHLPEYKEAVPSPALKISRLSMDDRTFIAGLLFKMPGFKSVRYRKEHNRGLGAYVDFEYTSQATHAMKLLREVIQKTHRRFFKVQYAIPNPGRRSDPHNILFVSHLEETHTRSVVEEIFSKSKGCRRTVLAKKFPALGARFAFVEYDTKENARRALRALHNRREFCFMQVNYAWKTSESMDEDLGKEAANKQPPK